jgi:hypothetical protein
MLLFLEIPVLIFISIGLYVALINRCATIVNDKGLGSLFYTIAISVLWFGGTIIGFFMGILLIFVQPHEHLTDLLGMVLCGVPISTLMFGGLAVLPVFIIAIIMPPTESVRRRQVEKDLRGTRSLRGDQSGKMVMIIVLITVLAVSCIGVLGLTGTGAYFLIKQL